MTERPILFSGPMVNAILTGRKTMTRRVVKPQDSVDECDGEVIHLHSKTCGGYCDYACGPLSCPYGQPGDRLWVRETWRTHSYGHDKIKPSALRQGEHIVHYDASMSFIAPFLGKGRPSIFMPRWASRITLEVTDVRVERLQHISEADAEAEGVEQCARRVAGLDGGCPSYKCGFQQIWQDINAKRCPWASNPFVWVVSFKRAGGK